MDDANVAREAASIPPAERDPVHRRLGAAACPRNVATQEPCSST